MGEDIEAIEDIEQTIEANIQNIKRTNTSHQQQQKIK